MKTVHVYFSQLCGHKENNLVLHKELLPDTSHASEIPLLSNPELILINGFYVDFLPVLGQRSLFWEEVHWLLK